MDIKYINLKVSQMIKSELTELTYATWAKFVENAYVEGNNIIIKVPNDFVKGIVENRYLRLFNSAYSYFRDEFKYDEIVVEVEENGVSDEYITHNEDKSEASDSSEGYDIKIYTAKEMKLIADQRNIKLVDIKKEAEKTLRKVLDTIKMMAQKGEYSTSYICDKAEYGIIENVTQELEKLGFRTQLVGFDNNKVISIKWD